MEVGVADDNFSKATAKIVQRDQKHSSQENSVNVGNENLLKSQIPSIENQLGE